MSCRFVAGLFRVIATLLYIYIYIFIVIINTATLKGDSFYPMQKSEADSLPSSPTTPVEPLADHPLDLGNDGE